MPKDFLIDRPVHAPELHSPALMQELRAWWEQARRELPPPGRDYNTEALELGEVVRQIRALSDWVSGQDGYLNRLLCKRERYQLTPHKWEGGLCTAYALEFIHARGAGARITDILTLMRHPSTAQRLIATQRGHLRGARALAAEVEHDPLWYGGSLRMLGESYARHRDAMTKLAKDRLAVPPSFTAAAGQRPRFLGRVPTTVTITGLLKHWPAHIHLMARKAASPIPPWHRDAKGRLEARQAMSARPPAPRSSHIAFLQWWSEVRMVIGRAEPGTGGLILCRMIAVEGLNHFIVLDVGSDEPGIFDPNFGYMPLNPRARFDNYAGWLLAFLLYTYGIQAIDLLSVPASAPMDEGATAQPVAPAALLFGRPDAKIRVG